MLVVEPEHEVAEQIDGGGVGPVDVVDEDDRRRGARVPEHEVGEREQRAGALALDHLGCVGGRRFERVGPHPLEHLTVRRRTGGVGDGDEQRVAQRQIREVEVVVAPPSQHRRPPPTGVAERLLREAGLADARLAFDDHQVAEAAERDVDAGPQPAQFGPPPDQRTRHRVSVDLTTRDERGTPAPRTRCRA